MFYYTIWRKDAQGKWHRTVDAYEKEQPRMQKSVFSHTAYWLLIPTTEQVYFSYRRKLERISSYYLYNDRDFRGIRYRNKRIWDAEFDDWFDHPVYIYNRHQRKHSLWNN